MADEDQLMVDASASANRRSHRTAVPDAVLLAAFAIGASLFVMRGWSRIAHPGMWAEDGTQFLPQSRSLGIASLVHPFAGYVHVLPRLIAVVLRPLPLTDIPEAYTLAAIAVTLAIFSTALSKRLVWLIPSRCARGLIFILLCLLPGLDEPYGNLANLIFVGAVATFFLGLCAEPESTPGRFFELLAVAVLVLSGPLSLLTFPVYARLLWRNRSRYSVAKVGVFVLAACVQLVVFLTSDRSTPGGGTATIYAKAVAIRIPGTWMAGSTHWRNDWLHGHLVRYGSVWISLVVLVALIVLRLDGAIILLVGAIGLAAAVHAYGAIVFVGEDRHLLLPYTVIVTAMVASAARCVARVQPLQRARSSEPPIAAIRNATWGVIAVGVLAAGANGIHRDFRLPAYSPRPNMTQLQQCVIKGSDLCTAPEAPRGWYVRLTRTQ